MAEQAKIVSAGALAVPQDVLDRLGWSVETDLELIETGDGLLVRKKVSAPGFDYAAFRRRVPKHEGPPASLEDMQRGIDQAMAERWARKEADSR